MIKTFLTSCTLILFSTTSFAYLSHEVEYQEDSSFAAPELSLAD